MISLLKRLLTILAISMVLVISLPAQAAIRIDAKAAIMIDASTGQIIYEQNANQQLPVASISKLLTIAVVHDELQQHAITDYTKVKVTPDIAAISRVSRSLCKLESLSV